MTSGEFGLVVQGVAQLLAALCLLWLVFGDSRKDGD